MVLEGPLCHFVIPNCANLHLIERSAMQIPIVACILAKMGKTELFDIFHTKPCSFNMAILQSLDSAWSEYRLSIFSYYLSVKIYLGITIDLW